MELPFRLPLLAAAILLAGIAVAQADDSSLRMRYANPEGSPERTHILTRLHKIVGRFIKHGFDRETYDTSHVYEPASALESLHAAGAANTVTWIGHMTTLLRLDGVTILTDPWWADYASPVPRLGPKRYVPPAIALTDLPPIDIVVVSHSHYDHLDLDAVAALPSRERTTAVVPRGIGHYFIERGYAHVFELDWHETVRIRGVSITALPAIHWSKRTLFKTNDTLWAAFSIEGPSGTRVYFGGDSDYGPTHAAARSSTIGYDVALLSIGGFHNAGVHCAPEACVRMGIDLGARVLIPLHWGTIYLGEGPPLELPRRFAHAAVAAGRDTRDTWIMRIGETRRLPPPNRPSRAPVLLAGAPSLVFPADAAGGCGNGVAEVC